MLASHDRWDMLKLKERFIFSIKQLSARMEIKNTDGSKKWVGENMIIFLKIKN